MLDLQNIYSIRSGVQEMSEARGSEIRDFDKRFCFRSFGVTVGVESGDPVLLEKAREVVLKAFGGRAQIFEEPSAETGHRFGIEFRDGEFVLYKNGHGTSCGASERNFFRYLNSLLRLEVGEFAEGCVFVHAGVVGWNGRAIMFPGISSSGKSTLTAELIRNGATYYSDEYAVLEADGRVSSFPRHLSLRYFGGTRLREVPPQELGAEVGRNAIPVGMVLVTSFSKGAKWDPEVLSAGSGIMEIIPNTLTMLRDPAFSLKVLDLVAQHAIMVKSPRGDAKKFAKFLLEFFDNHSK